MAIFYAPDILNTNCLTEEESNHAVRVLRMKEGESLEIIDGLGNLFQAEIIVANHKKCEVRITNCIHDYKKRDFSIHLAVAPTKNLDRIEWMAEKITEIGVDEITPLLCDHSERKVIKNDRIEKIIISAAKQSQKAFVPKFNDMCHFRDFVSKERTGDLFIAHCYNNEKKLLSKTYEPNHSATILIGPEGDFSEEEIKLALRCKFIPVSLGENRLRTETAAVVGVHTLNLINEINCN